MRVAVLSDVHSNRQALETVLAAVEAAGVEQIWCLGDMVGYGADPDACTALVRERCDICLVGNHDLAVLGELDISTFSGTAAAAVEWTRVNISRQTLDFLGDLRPTASRQGVGLYHASPRDPVWEYVLSPEEAEAGFDAQAERVALIGHSHVSLFFTRPDGDGPGYAQGAQAGGGSEVRLADGRWMLNPGSVGQPRDGDPRAAWLELDTEAWSARFHRLSYDVAAAAATIIDAGLPRILAERLATGR